MAFTQEQSEKLAQFNQAVAEMLDAIHAAFEQAVREGKINADEVEDKKNQDRVQSKKIVEEAIRSEKAKMESRISDQVAMEVDLAMTALDASEAEGREQAKAEREIEAEACLRLQINQDIAAMQANMEQHIETTMIALTKIYENEMVNQLPESDLYYIKKLNYLLQIEKKHLSNININWSFLALSAFMLG